MDWWLYPISLILTNCWEGWFEAFSLFRLERLLLPLLLYTTVIVCLLSASMTWGPNILVVFPLYPPELKFTCLWFCCALWEMDTLLSYLLSSSFSLLTDRDPSSKLLLDWLRWLMVAPASSETRWRDPLLSLQLGCMFYLLLKLTG